MSRVSARASFTTSLLLALLAPPCCASESFSADDLRSCYTSTSAIIEVVGDRVILEEVDWTAVFAPDSAAELIALAKSTESARDLPPDRPPFWFAASSGDILLCYPGHAGKCSPRAYAFRFRREASGWTVVNQVATVCL